MRGGGRVLGIGGGGGDEADELVSEPGPVFVLGIAPPANVAGSGLLFEAALLLRPDPLVGSGLKLELAEDDFADNGGAVARGTELRSGSESVLFFSAKTDQLTRYFFSRCSLPQAPCIGVVLIAN